MRKGGISTIVATVLIVLVTVASVSILWVAVLPLIQQVSFVEDPSVQVRIDPGEYTAYDEADDLLSVRVTRGADDADIVGLKFVIDDDGNTVTHKTYDILTPNSGKVYSFTTYDIGSVNSVGVVPIYNVGGSDVEGSTINTFDKLPEKVLTITGSSAAFGYSGTSVSDGLVVYYPFSSDVRDYSGNKINGILQCCDSSCVCSITGCATLPQLLDNALYFDGVDDYMNSSNSSIIDITQDTTLVAWIRPMSLPTKALIFKKQYGNEETYSIWSYGSGLRFETWNKSGDYYIGDTAYSTSILKLDKWQLVAITVDSSSISEHTINFYYNGRLVNSQSKTFNANVINSQGLSLGLSLVPNSGTPTVNSRYNGYIDDIMIFNKVLSSEQIEKIYEEGRSE